MQLRYRENHPDIKNIVLTGTDTIIEEVNVLTSILSEFSRFARLPEMKPEYDDLNASVESCVNFFHGHERVAFHVDLDPGVGSVLFDKMLLRQALTNIIQNSIDAVEDRGNIHIATRRLDGTVAIHIRDDGTGIKPEDLDKIFEPTFSTKPHGTGIGLTIVEKIILEHHGRISCRSKPGEGAEFVIELPATPQGGAADGKNTHR
jgi:two-component system nitrogen regulation sensor histidine kinase NtrY